MGCHEISIWLSINSKRNYRIFKPIWQSDNSKNRNCIFERHYTRYEVGKKLNFK
ncbi:hypothetical protein NEISICOT_00346 [Neisseria sicca ATCC 29256]|uniref:Uncharacterized protein n=1 Tax=Neisseria sicca ATCC 29256 TaxID=547045 RepID=C6M1G1_NEISI|nr:hypothetical protein NEISICOT_00346 [Neisseria sicca ATCC 29256]